ncbi:MAG: phytanoyl-CoA dioxygenase family protein [Pseudomonadales bacterium]|nr:phytanoyl-CoA dioxygenase family protein [Pseudomonadales bacterium]
MSSITTLTTFPSTATAADVSNALDVAGACIVRDALAPELLARFQAETAPLVENSSAGRDDFAGSKTRRTGALIATSSACRDIAQHPLILETAKEFLSPWCRRIQLMLTQIIAIYPDEKAQVLHRDRLAWGGYIPQNIEPQLNTIWAISDFTVANGATQVVPGSHRWEAGRDANPEEVVQAEMPAGSVLIYTGSVIHGGGANHSQQVRTALNIDYCLDWLRQEENQYLSCPPEIARQFPKVLTDLIGYTAGGYALGYYTDPGATADHSTRLAELAVGHKPATDGFLNT